MKINRIPYELKKAIFYRNPILRRFQTKNYTSKKIAIGESNDYHFPKDWITIDYERADHNIDLNSEYVLPFDDNSIDLAYSAHCIEHLTEEKAAYVFKEIFRVLNKGGKIRIEVPDVTRIIDHYKRLTPEYLEHFEERYNYMCDILGYNEKYKEKHVGLLGTISNYFDLGVDYQIPVYATKNECDSNLDEMNTDEFCEWCVGLQTEDQYKSAGHKSYFYFNKMKAMLQKAGFSNVSHLNFNESNANDFKLNNDSKKSIKEKEHRRFYSLYVEAEKN